MLEGKNKVVESAEFYSNYMETSDDLIQAILYSKDPDATSLLASDELIGWDFSRLNTELEAASAKGIISIDSSGVVSLTPTAQKLATGWS